MRLRYFAAGFLAAIILSTGVAVFANSEMRELIFGVSVVVHGEALELDGINRPFIMDGRTFLPVAVIADALDIPVEWDGETSTVRIGNLSPLLGQWEVISHSYYTDEDFQAHIAHFGRMGVRFYHDGTLEMDWGNWHEPHNWFAEDGVITLYDDAALFHNAHGFSSIYRQMSYSFSDGYLILVDMDFPEEYMTLRRFEGIWFEPILLGRWTTTGLFPVTDPSFDPTLRWETAFFEDGTAEMIDYVAYPPEISTWAWHAEDGTITFHIITRGNPGQADTWQVDYRFEGSSLILGSSWKIRIE